MTEFAQAEPLPVYRISVRWQTVFLFLVGFLSSTILLKVGGVQYLELVYFGLLFVLLVVFAERGYRATWYKLLFWYALAYAAFCLIALALSFAALRFDFYLPTSIDPLKRPVAITLSRIAELTASIGAMLYMAHLFVRDLSRARLTMKVYFWTGVASAIYSLLSIPLKIAGIAGLGAYSDLHRLRGFYNEGGPYGLYVLSVLLVGIALDRLDWVSSRRNHRIIVAVLCVVFIMSYSKAAIFAVLTIFVVNGLFASTRKARVTIVAVGVVVVGVLSHFVDFTGIARVYERSSANYERSSHLHSKDPNFVYGRVAAGYIVPRMIQAHPWSGVGWGNYGLLRNAPEYRGAAVFTELADDPGLGMFGLAAELGLPLIAFLLLLILAPYIFLRRLRAPGWLTNLSLMQPLAHLFGGQLNLTYPWVVTAFALGLGFAFKHNRNSLEAAREVLPS